MIDYPFWSLVVSLFAALGGFAAAIFVGVQVRQAARNTKEGTKARQREWDLRRRQATLEFYQSTLESRENRRTRLPPDRDAVGIARFLEEAKTDTAKLDTIRTHLSFYEMLATGVNAEVLDLGVVDAFGGGPILAAWRNYWPWIEERRLEFKAPSMFEEFECLASKIAHLRGEKFEASKDDPCVDRRRSRGLGAIPRSAGRI